MSIFIRYIVEFCVNFNLTYSEGFKDQWTLALGYSEANFAVRLFNFAIIKLLAQLQLCVKKDEILL